MQVNIVLFEGLTQLDMTGPYEVLAAAPGFTVDLVAKTREPVRSDRGLAFVPTRTLDDAPPCDLLVVPGGPGTDAALLDPDWVAFTRRQALAARHVFGICTGSLLLGAAGLLKGRRASTHWRARAAGGLRRHAQRRAPVRGRQLLYRGRRHFGHRHGAQGGGRPVRPGDGAAHPAPDRIRPQTAVSGRHAAHVGAGHRAAVPCPFGRAPCAARGRRAAGGRRHALIRLRPAHARPA